MQEESLLSKLILCLEKINSHPNYHKDELDELIAVYKQMDKKANSNDENLVAECGVTAFALFPDIIKVRGNEELKKLLGSLGQSKKLELKLHHHVQKILFGPPTPIPVKRKSGPSSSYE